MSSRRRSARLVAALVGVVAALTLLAGPAAVAAPTPYTDPAVVGGIGLCDQHGAPVTSGSVHDKPFVWRAVSTVAAPTPYGGAGRKATLYAFQPRPDTDAGQWNGDTLTATSAYSNPQVPMAQATGIDFALQDFLDEYRPMVDGLIQLRLLLGATGAGTDTTAYPALDIRVTGDRWQAVDPVSVACTAGSATSSEIAALGPAKASALPQLPAGSSGTPSRAVPATSAPSATVPGSGASTSKPRPAATVAASAGSGARAAVPTLASRSRSSSVTGWWLGAGAILLALVGAVVLRRRYAG